MVRSLAGYNKRRPRHKKGQQALEYIVTYGWAFVVVLITIGAFAYFGIFNPQKYLPDQCVFGEQLACVDYLLTAVPGSSGTVSLKFQNNFGEDIVIWDVQTIEGYGGLVGSSVVITNGVISDAVVLDLDDVDNNNYILIDGEKSSIPIMVNFSRNAPGAPYHRLIGEVFATAQE